MHTVALTNTAGSAITQRCDAVVDLAAEPEVGGVACRSYQHTLRCCWRWSATSRVPHGRRWRALLRCRRMRARICWIPRAIGGLRFPSRCWGRAGIYLAAPADRFCSAQQGALMLREGPRLQAVGMRDGRLEPCRRLPDEDHSTTGCWFSPGRSGSRSWRNGRPRAAARSSAWVDVVQGTQYNLRYPGDGDDDVRLLTEVLVPELIAARAWQAQRM